MWIGSEWRRDTPWRRTAPDQSPGDSCYANARTAGARITWLPPGSHLRVLGVDVGYSVDVAAVWAGIAQKMLTQLRLWQLSKLSLLARVLVLKVMVWSKAILRGLIPRTSGGNTPLPDPRHGVLPPTRRASVRHHTLHPPGRTAGLRGVSE